MYPDWESKLRPFGAWDDTQPTDPHWPVLVLNANSHRWIAATTLDSSDTGTFPASPKVLLYMLVLPLRCQWKLEGSFHDHLKKEGDTDSAGLFLYPLLPLPSFYLKEKVGQP